MPRGIADERDSADRTVTPTGNKTKMNGFVEISTLLIHSAPKQKSNEWMHLSPFYTRMHGEWLRYAKSTSQFHWRFLLVRDGQGFQVNPLCRHDITRSDRQIGNTIIHYLFNTHIYFFLFKFARQTCSHIIVCVVYCVFAILYIAYLYICILLFYNLCPVLLLSFCCSVELLSL